MVNIVMKMVKIDGKKSINTKKEGFLPPNVILFYGSLVLYWFFISIPRLLHAGSKPLTSDSFDRQEASALKLTENKGFRPAVLPEGRLCSSAFRQSHLRCVSPGATAASAHWE